jgi:uncharacterized protein DUF5076
MRSHELPIPPPALKDAKSRELVRVWAASGKQHISLATGLWDDPATWGIMLVDLARHLARAYKQTHGMDHDRTLARIRGAIDAEWAEDTDSDRIGGLHSEEE